MTHRLPTDRPLADENFVFVADGIEAAIDRARELAGGTWVGVNGGTVARQCLDAGLLDEVHIDLVPVILGGGTPFFSELQRVPVELEGPVSVVEGTGVTHLRYRWQASGPDHRRPPEAPGAPPVTGNGSTCLPGYP